MRDKRFIAEHRGGLLCKEHHRLLIMWASACAMHVLGLINEKPDNILTQALEIAHQWAQGESPTGAAMKAARETHAYARTLSDPVDIAIARAVGHAVATAHMADHSMGAAIYSLKAVKLKGVSLKKEKNWQTDQLPEAVRDLILSAIPPKEKAFHLI